MVLYSWKFSPGENIHQFCHLLLLVNSYPMNIMSNRRYSDLHHIGKINNEYFCIAKVTGLGEFVCPEKISAIQYIRIS